MKLSSLGEFGLIERIKKQSGVTNSVIKGIGDDAAVVQASGRASVLLTTDMLVEGVHFTKKIPASLIGRKALACSISDIAAMGGIPKYALISLGVAPNLSVKFVDELYEGMEALARRFGVAIVGGDTVKSDKVIINVALTGEARSKEIVYRSGAKPGDLIFVTGALGRSLKSGHHLTFTPRVRESQYLVKHYKPTAMIDISDGLAADLGHILTESGVGATLEEEDILLRRGASLSHALHDGEDFELLFTLSPKAALEFGHIKHKRFSFTCIGEIIKAPGKLYLIDLAGRERQIKGKGFRHF